MTALVCRWTIAKVANTSTRCPMKKKEHASAAVTAGGGALLLHGIQQQQYHRVDVEAQVSGYHGLLPLNYV